MEFRVLGPLEVRRDGRSIELRGSKRRAVLAILLLHANEVVRTDRLIDELWSEDRPANASAALHNHVSRLRKDLGDVLVTKPWGYVLRTDPEAIDLRRFERLLAEATPLAAHERTAKLAEALALWRGPALADLAREPALAVEIACLEELRLSALEQRIDADLELGSHAKLARELEALVGEHPLRERLRGQLILALYRSGRQAEALETYRETRRVLVEELGIEPSPELRELERAILRQDTSLASPPPPLQELVDNEPPQSHWRWPRSPLVATGLVLLLAAAGGATAIIATKGGASHDIGAVPAADAAWDPSPRAASATEKSARDTPDRGSVAELQRQASPSRVAAKPSSATASRSRPVRKTVASATRRAASSVAHVRTHPKASRATKTQRKTTPKSIRITDTFSSSTMNPQLWTLMRLGTGVDVAQKDGHLELTMHPDATPDTRWNSMSGQYQTSCSFTGDFDARIDYALIGWPAANGTVVALNVVFPDNVVNIVRKSLASGQEDYAFWAPSSGESRNVQTTDMTGGFRMTRVAGLITAYYRSGPRWLKFDWVRRAGAVHLEVILWASGSDFQHKDVTVAFDNFSVEAPYSACA